jgi:putative DNA methylase
MKKKLIEVALPLEAINVASAKEKNIRHGHPSTLHLWWARRPLAAARAVIFAQMVDDPSAHPDLFKTEKAQEKERQRLFKIIEELVRWENTTNESVLQQARDEIWRSWRRTCAQNADHPQADAIFDRNKLPAFHDPFAGGGALPLEAQRLGLVAYASDLNPVAVLINKAMIEIPPKFAGKPPLNPETREDEALFQKTWRGARGLAEDIRYYGKWMRDEAEKRIGHLYPNVEITSELAYGRPDLKPLIGRELKVIAWLWARTVKSPNPAYTHVEVPLASTFLLSTKTGKTTYVEPVIEGGGYRFAVAVGKPKDAEGAKLGTTAGKRAAFRCLMSGVPITYDYIRSEGRAGRLGARLMAVVAEGDRGRLYVSPPPEHEAAAQQAKPLWKPELALPDNPRDFKTPNYGLTTFGDLFTPRQLVALTTFSDLVQEVCERVRRDALAAGLPLGRPLAEGGTDAEAYKDAIAVYLGMAGSKMADAQSSLCRWKTTMDQSIATFGRQALPMVWDYSEANAFGGMAGDPFVSLKNMLRVLDQLPTAPAGHAAQVHAQSQSHSAGALVSTDPPYYDNIGYADLSDFFYVWLRRSLKSILPELFATLAVPKTNELVATPYRHGNKAKAEAFFLDGMSQAMHRIAEHGHPAFPVTIYYAFKQSETEGAEGTSSTGWETFLDAVIRAGFSLSGTWPMRTELANKISGVGHNMLASSIILVCRPRAINARTVSRREFVTALKAELPAALAHLQRSNIAPVDLAQAAIGPGMAVYTRFAHVLDAAGKPMTVREALALINQELDGVLTQQEGDFDADSRFAITWFEQWGFDEGEYGVAETLATARNTSVAGMKDAGILASKGGRVRLLAPDQLPADWDPTLDSRLTAWEMVHHLIRTLEGSGETATAQLLKRLGSRGEIARELAYRLYLVCERSGRAALALSYNALVQSWPEVTRLARQEGTARPTQLGLEDLET